MTDAMALSKPTPQDVRDRADDIVLLMSGRTLDTYTLRQMVEMGIMAERRRCLNIIDAEGEWGGDLREAERKIDKGEGPRRIPGYNAPSSDE